MNRPDGPKPPAEPDVGSNPFSTRYTRPGALEFDETAGPSLDALLAELARRRWRGQIVGPHGTGKTTLLESLLPRLSAAGRRVERFSLRPGQRRLQLSRATRASWDAKTLLVVDGYEQLNWWRRWRIQSACHRGGWGLLVTTHRPLGLPLLVQMRPTAVLVRRLVRQLWPEHDRLIGDREIDACFERQAGNVRETLFALYDLFEQRTRTNS